MNRQETLASLTSRSPTVLIIGAGINGIGTFLDLALQGVDTLIIDRADFCSGASAASSRMAHGGIRYLENGEFRLVREAVQERNLMLHNAPALVEPLPTTIPIFRLLSGLFNSALKFLGWLERPAERGALIIKVGLMLYDAYTGRQPSVPRHTFLNRRRSLERFPGLNPSVAYTATYFDGLIRSPERYALELLLAAERQGSHARALNYVSLMGMEAGKVTLRDEISQAEIALRPRLIVNAAGPWIDGINQKVGNPTRYIGATKGSHLVLDNPELRAAIGGHEFFFENKDGRIVLILPLFDRVMVGTSDLPIEDPDSARCSDEEVEYFLGMISRVFPGIPVSREQIVFRVSGVRPLAFTDARLAGQITRDHHIRQDEAGGIPVLSLIGGKWTSYRAFSEQVTDRLLALLGMDRRQSTRLLQVGTDLPAYALRTEATLSREEISQMAEREKVIHLDDLLLRRTLPALLGKVRRARLEGWAGDLAAALGWDASQTKHEIERCAAILADRHAVVLK